MDHIDWIKEVTGTFATHGPWALFCLYLAWNYIRDARATLEVQKTIAETLTRLATLIEMQRSNNGASK